MLLLVIDDDALSRDLLELLLQAEGYEVELAALGEAAIAWIASRAQDGLPNPDVILTDIQMPGLSGDSLAIALKALLPGTPLLAMSGSEPAISALTSFDGFLLKPFKVSTLKALISPTALEGGIKEHDLLEHDILQNNGAKREPLNEDIYSKLCDLMPIAQLGEMYALCLDDARRRIAHMEFLAANGNEAQFRSEAHAVKGGCGMIGASELHELAAKAEQDGLESRDETSGTTGVTEMLTRLSGACDRLERILQERTRE